MRSSTTGTNGFSSVAAGVTTPRVPDLKQKELLEDQPMLCRRAERVQHIDRGVVRREMRLLYRGPSRNELQACTHLRRERIGNLRRQLIERLANQSPLHVRRDHAGLLVERHDAPGVHARDVVRHELVLGVHEVQARRVELDVAEDHDLEVCSKYVGEKRLVHPRAADGAARVADDGVKNLEAAPARDREIG